MDLASLILGVVGVLLAFYFGIRSLLQSQNLEGLQEALKAYNQGVYNDVWRIGHVAGAASESDDLEATHQMTHSIGEMSHLIRHHVVAFSNRHTGFTPSYQSAWDPKPLPLEPPRGWWNKFFQL
jgi:hypothetical protein